MDSSVTKPTAEQVKDWDKNRLLEWIKNSRPEMLEVAHLEKFQAEDITGNDFLDHAGDVGFFKFFCGLPAGPSGRLAKLARELAEAGGETSSVKRDSEQAGLAESSEAVSKRRNLDSRSDITLPKLAQRARERRDLVLRSIVTRDGLSNPALYNKLPFPFVGPLTPTRFKISLEGSEDYWSYMGRERFTELVDTFKDVRERRDRSALWVYGTKGYGKSFLLAALVCYLTAQKERVLYIPDCRECVKDPVEYVRAAMLFAWADDDTILEKIMTLKTQEDMYTFFHSHHSEGLIFIIDQLNAFAELEDDGGESRDWKGKINRWLIRCRSSHKAVLSTSANYRAYLQTSVKQSTEVTMRTYGGLTLREVEQWWKQNKNVMDGDVIRGGYTKDEIEDFTGSIPLFLDNCVVKDKMGQPFAIDLGTVFFNEIYSEAKDFVRQIHKQNLDWPTYCRYMTACLSRHVVPSPSSVIPKLVDHRYFYDEFRPERGASFGNYACGIARNAVAAGLREEKVNFADTDFLNSLPNYINNPVVAGFMIEQAVLSSIETNGLAIGGMVNTPMELIMFRDSFPDFQTNITDRPLLYCPRQFNFPGIDGIIVRIAPEKKNVQEGLGGKRKYMKQGKRKISMFPLQITLSPGRHSDSHKTFFDQYEEWTKNFSDFDVETEFIWITPEPPLLKKHRRDSKFNLPSHSERYLPFKNVNQNIWDMYNYAKKFQKVPEELGGGEQQQGSREKLGGAGEGFGESADGPRKTRRSPRSPAKNNPE